MYSTIEQAVHAVGNPLQAKTLLRIGLVTAAQPDAYAAAPIDLGHRPVGMLHADRSTVAGTVDASDLDLIGILAEGIGVIIERNIATQQLRSLQSAARQHMHEIHSLAAMFDEYPASDTDAGPGTGPPVKPVDDNDGLTHRELQVLRLMAAGSTNKQIADQLGIGAGTVKSHVRNILTKLGVHNRADAVAKSPELLSF